jgi:hypothetical protein
MKNRLSIRAPMPRTSWMGAVLAVAGTVGLSTQAADEATRKALPVAKLTRTEPPKDIASST